ncbi:MAG: hypothetical protein ACE5DM_00280 [Candidatus Nanoarchaeia archaeon]
MRTKILFLTVVALMIISLAGCDEFPTGHAVSDLQGKGSEPLNETNGTVGGGDGGPGAGLRQDYAPREYDPSQDNPDEREEPREEPESPDEVPERTSECQTDDDCDDGADCTIDKCEYPGGPYALCSHTEVTRATNTQRDGCCPSWENADTDMDCEPVCVNGRCEYGEKESTCPEDCEHAGGSGSGAPATRGAN